MENNGHVLRLRLISAGTLDEIYASLIRQIVSTPLGAENWSFASAPCVKIHTSCGRYSLWCLSNDRVVRRPPGTPGWRSTIVRLAPLKARFATAADRLGRQEPQNLLRLTSSVAIVCEKSGLCQGVRKAKVRIRQPILSRPYP